jgi:hypothetical protein
LEEGAVRVIEDFTLDLFTLLRSHTFADFAGTARSVEVDGVSIRYLSPQALIELKSPSIREKDQLDVASLRRIVAGEIAPGIADLDRLTP